MSTPDDRPAPHPEPPRWDTPPQPPAWDRPVQGQGWGPPPAHTGDGGYGGPPAAYGYGGSAQTDSKAVVGLVLAIGSWVLLPFLAAIAALVVARSSRRDIEASGGRLSGEGLNTATRVIAWANIGLCLAAVVLGVLAVVLFALAA